MSFLFCSILLCIFLCSSGMLLLQDILLMSVNLVLFKSLLIGKFNGAFRKIYCCYVMGLLSETFRFYNPFHR